MSVGIWQLFLIFMVVLILFGAGRIPRVMGDIGKGIKSLKEGLKDEEVTTATKDIATKDIKEAKDIKEDASIKIDNASIKDDSLNMKPDFDMKADSLNMKANLNMKDVTPKS